MGEMNNNKPTVPDEVVMNKIYLIRDQKVMIDADLAELYGIETKRLKEQVRRNRERFPDDFMFQLTTAEHQRLRSQFASLNKSRGQHAKYLPFAFTEHGVLMLSNVVNSKRAIAVNIQIIRIFIKMREMLLTHQDLLIKMNKLESKISNHDENIRQIFAYLKQLIREEAVPRKTVGFRQRNNNS